MPNGWQNALSAGKSGADCPHKPLPTTESECRGARCGQGVGPPRARHARRQAAAARGCARVRSRRQAAPPLPSAARRSRQKASGRGTPRRIDPSGGSNKELRQASEPDPYLDGPRRPTGSIGANFYGKGLSRAARPLRASVHDNQSVVVSGGFPSWIGRLCLR